MSNDLIDLDIPTNPDCRVAFRVIQGDLGIPEWEL